MVVYHATHNAKIQIKLFQQTKYLAYCLTINLLVSKK